MGKWNTEPLLRLAKSFTGARWEEAVWRACAQNPWFTPTTIAAATRAVQEQMLDREKLAGWLAAYEPPCGPPHRVGIVMAGNLPMVGLADLVAVVAAGYRAVVKPSSKDRALMEYVVGELCSFGCQVELVDELRAEAVDGVIATGGDAARSHFASAFAGVPALLRGNRTSVAVLTGAESEAEVGGLADDIFLYWGMGCRSVSRLLVPRGYDLAGLAGRLAEQVPAGHGPYEDCSRYARAMAAMEGGEWLAAGPLVLRRVSWQESGTPRIAEVFWTEYASLDEVREWLGNREPELQCVASATDTGFPRQVALGRTQFPAPGDYADGVDTMQFLLELP